LAGSSSKYTSTFVAFLITPQIDFQPLSNDQMPKYHELSAWVAHPEKQDGADVLAEGEVDSQHEAIADVFFIHPTTYFRAASWNDPLDGSGDKIIKKNNTLMANASVFNNCCRIFSPVYRQATIATYLSPKMAKLDPINTAFADVLAAFDFYMEHYNKGRPIFIAGHSQGADHGFLLLKHRFSEQALLEKLVAAYLPGRPIGMEHLLEGLPDIPICQSPTQTGCFISYMTVGPKADFAKFRSNSIRILNKALETYDSSHSVCVNPLNWTSSNDWSGKGQGLFRYDKNSKLLTFREQTVRARCVDGALVIDPVFYGLFTGYSNYHIHDVALFYKETRGNIGERLKNFE